MVVGAFLWLRYLRFVPTSTSVVTPGNTNALTSGSAVIYAVGDIADCDTDGDESAAALLAATTGSILTLGDTVYPDGSPERFRDCFDPAWGAYKARIRPVPGNHDYVTKNAAGYFAYFGAAAAESTGGYYSYDLGGWHLIALNSNCSAVGGCGAASPMLAWLKDDLARHLDACTLAYYHHPRWSSGQHGSDATLQDLWQILVDGGVDVVLNGHDHDYERFAPLDAEGRTATNGTREFVVGTGGKSRYTFSRIEPASQVRDNTSFGVLKFMLGAGDYAWEFLPVAGADFADRGKSSCQ